MSSGVNQPTQGAGFMKEITHTLIGFIIVMVSAGAVANEPVHPSPSAQSASSGRGLTLTPVDQEPADGRKAITAAQLEKLRKAVREKTQSRTKHFELVRGLIRAGALQEAVEAAQEWRKHDAYNLVVVRMLGDLYTELGQTTKARRIYSAVVELLPTDARAHRALATVLKQRGDLDGAYQRLMSALTLQPKDARIAFELADVAQRLGRLDEAKQRFETIVGESKLAAKIRYPAKQRLGQILATQRRRAASEGNTARSSALKQQLATLKLAGGVENDIKIYLSWDTDRTDVDLWVTNPAGQKVFYKTKKGRFGGTLYDDVTNGYGPESFTARAAVAGMYSVHVNYFSGGRGTFKEARGEVIVVLNEGRDSEERIVLPYRLFRPGQTVTVAQVRAQ